MSRPDISTLSPATSSNSRTIWQFPSLRRQWSLNTPYWSGNVDWVYRLLSPRSTGCWQPWHGMLPVLCDKLRIKCIDQIQSTGACTLRMPTSIHLYSFQFPSYSSDRGHKASRFTMSLKPPTSCISHDDPIITIRYILIWRFIPFPGHSRVYHRHRRTSCRSTRR